MITQRPETGSRRSSGIKQSTGHRHNLPTRRSHAVERILKHFDFGTARVEVDRHHIEPAGAVGQTMPAHVVDRELRDPPALERRDRFGGRPKRMAVARLHFDENDRLPVSGDDVDFSTAAAIAPRDNCVPAPFEFGAGEIFAGFSKNYTSSGHVSRAQQHLRHPTTKNKEKKKLSSSQPPSVLRRKSRPRFPLPRASAPAAAKSGRRSFPRRGPAGRD